MYRPALQLPLLESGNKGGDPALGLDGGEHLQNEVQRQVVLQQVLVHQDQEH